ncbi:MAG: 2Fe-2S iron-sulfur cluster binding domain-containing protein [Alphaproteobacteria bacterium]|nr:2Fe-2S iron-sulfur cluster binding domain-containing protein [Alphaproteobacteria bacterium]
MKLIVTDRTGNEHELTARDDWSAMEVIRDANLPLSAECGGACACATCHVYVDEAWTERLPAAQQQEIDMLDFGVAVQENSRLSCQIKMTPELEGLKVTLAPESL